MSVAVTLIMSVTTLILWVAVTLILSVSGAVT